MNNRLNHVAFIMDGNNRWSKKNKENLYNGYKRGADTLLNLTDYIFGNTSAKFVSAFALSKNNLNRSKTLISTLKKVLIEFCSKDKKLFNFNNEFNIRFIGNRDFLSKKINLKIDELEKYKTSSNKYLLIFINYSGKDDIKQASKKLNKNKSINQNKFEDFLLTADIPDPDLLIRTGGFKRLSDFLIYQSSFTELFFMNKLWPDLKKRDLLRIFTNFYKIERKFGR